jgi:hypothetical protein
MGFSSAQPIIVDPLPSPPKRHFENSRTVQKVGKVDGKADLTAYLRAGGVFSAEQGEIESHPLVKGVLRSGQKLELTSPESGVVGNTPVDLHSCGELRGEYTEKCSASYSLKNSKCSVQGSAMLGSSV